MAEISAAAVKSLRDRTGLPMMKCKQALQNAGGDEEAAIKKLREEGAKTMATRSDRETAFGRFGIYADVKSPAGAMVELKCESAPVAAHEEFIGMAADFAKQLATGPGAQTADELLDQPSPSKSGMTLRQQKEDMFNRMGEVFNVGRFVRFDGPCGGYSHNAGTVSGVLVQVEGGTQEAAKDVAMHIAATRPTALKVEDLPAEDVAKEREFLSETARKEGKPENIIAKMVEGRMRNFYAERVLLEQPFVKDDKQTVGKFAEANKMKIVKFKQWELGRE